MNNSSITECQSVTPNATGVGDIGSSTAFWDTLYTENIRFRGLDPETSTAFPYITHNGVRMLFQNTSNDSFVFKVDTDEILIIDDDKYMYPNAGDFGYFVQDIGGSAAIGTFGSLQVPFDAGGDSSAAVADGDFGAFLGCIGVYGRSGSSALLSVRVSNGDWHGVILTTTLT